MQSNLQPSPFSVPSLPFLAANQKFLQAGARLQANAFNAAMRYQIETLSFLKRRCEADAKLMDDLAGSGEFNDTFDVVTNFVQNAASEYTAEVSKFVSIGSKLASETAKYARDESRKALEDVAATTTVG
jgi:Phasin protein.